MAFANVVDYFGMGGNVLVPQSSSDGAQSNVTEVAECVHYCAREVTGDLLNPSVVYAVRNNGNVLFKLGKGYDSGFMLTSVTVTTQAGQHPTVTFKGVANEGGDAVAASTASPSDPPGIVRIAQCQFSIRPRSRSQDVADAFGNIDGAISITTEYSVNPVVVFNSGSIVASDVVHPKITVNATFVKNAMGAINGGWDVVSNTNSYGGTDWGTRTVTLVKNL